MITIALTCLFGIVLTLVWAASRGRTRKYDDWSHARKTAKRYTRIKTVIDEADFRASTPLRQRIAE